MKKLLLVGKTLEYALYIAATAYLFRIICSILIGYVFVTSEYAGPCYYYWRKAHCDVDASKTTYSYIAENSENDYDVFKTYIRNAQPQITPAKSKEEEKVLKSAIALDKETMKSASGDEAEELKKRIEDNEQKLEDLSLTAGGFKSLYADSKFTDSFILGPKKIYKIFIDKKHPRDISKLEPELNFLNFRLVFINYMKAKNPKTSRYSILNRGDIESFFRGDNAESLAFTEVPGSNGLLTSVSFNGLESAKPLIISTSRVEPIKQFIKIYKPFNAILEAMKTRKPIVTFDGDQVLIDEDALKHMVEIVNLSGLDGFLGSDEESIKDAIRGFFDRIAKIKPTEFDSHILNRLYYYYFFMNSDLAPEDVLEKDEAYRLARQKSDKAKDDAEEASDGDTKRDLENKAKVFESKYLERRTQLIFNHFSQLIAENLGDKGYLLNEGDDNRLFFFKWFAYPHVYFSSDEEKHRSIFNDPLTA